MVTASNITKVQNANRIAFRTYNVLAQQTDARARTENRQCSGLRFSAFRQTLPDHMENPHAPTTDSHSTYHPAVASMRCLKAPLKLPGCE